jgi:hypothetical protein
LTAATAWTPTMSGRIQQGTPNRVRLLAMADSATLEVDLRSERPGVDAC